MQNHTVTSIHTDLRAISRAAAGVELEAGIAEAFHTMGVDHSAAKLLEASHMAEQPEARTTEAMCAGQCFAKCPFTCQFDRLSDQLCRSLDRLLDHFAKH